MEILALIIFLIFCALGAWLEDDEPDPLDLARPSIEHLRAEARRAAEELRALDRDQERP